MQHIAFSSVLVGIGVASLLNVAALLVMRYVWKWDSHIPDSMAVEPPTDLKSKQRVVIETGQGSVVTEVTHLDDLLPLRGSLVSPPNAIDRYYVKGSVVVIDLSIAWAVTKNVSVTAVCVACLWLLVDAKLHSAAMIIGPTLAVPAWWLLYALALVTQAEKMAAYADVLKRVCSHNNSLQARRP